MDMCWYVSSCLVACVCRYVVSVVNCVVSSIVGMLSRFGSRLVSFRYVVKCKFSEVVCSKGFASNLV